MCQVSVIIPCYNHAHYLPDALNSVLAQTFTDWEAIVVDDGSTDNTREVTAQFTDARIRYVYQENRGLSAARNTGIRHANGQYLTFLDADDEWDPFFLGESHVRLANDSSLAGVYCASYFIDEGGKKLAGLIGRIVDRHQSAFQLQERNLAPVHAFLVRADCINAVGLFDESLTSLEDWDLWLRISKIGAIEGFAKPLARYRITPQSMSTNAHRMFANRLTILTKHYGNPEGSPETWAARKCQVFSFAHVSCAVSLVMIDDEQSEQLLRKAVEIWPSVLIKVETYYELLCARQPRGYVGTANKLNVEAEAIRVQAILDRLFSISEFNHLNNLRCQANAVFKLSIAMLYDQTGDWARARNELVNAVLLQPHLLLDQTVLRRLFKLIIGKKATAASKGLLYRWQKIGHD